MGFFSLGKKATTTPPPMEDEEPELVDRNPTTVEEESGLVTAVMSGLDDRVNCMWCYLKLNI